VDQENSVTLDVDENGGKMKVFMSTEQSFLLRDTVEAHPEIVTSMCCKDAVEHLEELLGFHVTTGKLQSVVKYLELEFKTSPPKKYKSDKSMALVVVMAKTIRQMYIDLHGVVPPHLNKIIARESVSKVEASFKEWMTCNK